MASLATTEKPLFSTDASEIMEEPLDITLAPPDSLAVLQASNQSYPNEKPSLTKGSVVNNIKDVETPVTYLEKLRCISWSAGIMISQLRRDLVAGRFFQPLLSTDFATHYFYLPIGRRNPRLVTSAPKNRMTIRIIPKKLTRVYDDIEDLNAFPSLEMVNCASNGYGGFSDIEPGMQVVIDYALRSLPFCPPPKAVEDSVRLEVARYMGFDQVQTAPSGFSTNILAFAAVASVAAEQGRSVIFLMDRDCHNSMFTGAFYNKGAKIHKFKHNDMADLENMLRMYGEQNPLALICVAVEGIYSMEGSVCPAPTLLALKHKYHFCLLVDEAHSLMAIGSQGRGSFNQWQDDGYDCPFKSIDIMVFTLSKSFGCTGGFVLANGVLASQLRVQEAKGIDAKTEKLSTIILLRVLGVLKKPKLVQHRMKLLREKAEYVANELRAAGCRVSSSQGSPSICFPIGSIRQCVYFHGEAQRLGIALAAGVPPATPVWGCRIRISVRATTTWPDIYNLLTTVVAICRKLKVRGVRPISFDQSLLYRRDGCDDLVEQESEAVNAELLDYVNTLRQDTAVRSNEVWNGSEVIATASHGLQKYGIGTCSARWHYGTFDSFIRLEQRLAKLYPSLLDISGGHCRGMISSDGEITLGSTLTALAIPTSNSKKKQNQVFVYENASKGILDGVNVARDTKGVVRKYYENIDEIPSMLECQKATHLTFYFLTCNENGHQILDLTGLFSDPKFSSGRTASNIKGITIMLDDRNGLGRIGPHKLGYLDHMESLHGQAFLSEAFSKLKSRGVKVRCIVAGSWYNSFGHQGGYVTGHKDTVEALTYDAKAYFFSTPPMPLQAMMTDKTLEILSRKRDMK